jgi:MFS family permease
LVGTQDDASLRIQRRNLRAMMADGSAYSVMVGVAETYLPAFALALGMGEVVAGLIATVPLLGGAVLQLISPAAVLWLGSNRRWVLLCAVIQAISFVPMVIGALAGWIPVPLLFVIAAVYWGSNMAGVAAWNTWAGTLVPVEIRARFFSWRTRFTQTGVLLGYVLGGLALQTGANLGHPLGAFALIFVAAGACRMISTGFLATQTEPVPPDETHRIVRPLEVLRRFRHRGEGRLLLFLILMQGATQIASPYFAPFMLQQLRFSYATFMIVAATIVLAKAVALPTLGRLAQRHDARWLLAFGATVMIPIPLLWLISNAVGWLLVVQSLAGIAWGAYELAMFLMILERIDESERTSVLTTFNVAHAAATVTGASLGALLISFLGASHGAYMAVFVLSAAMRLGTVPFLQRIPARTDGAEAIESAGSETLRGTIALPSELRHSQNTKRIAA